MALAPGTRLGPYEIVSLLGAGGMGEVYRARDSRLDRTIAIKILSQLSTDPAQKQRFEREARAISGLNHPNICTLHDIGHQNGIAYLVMECVEGETLAKRLEKGPLPIDQVLKIGSQIADALDKAHRSGIVHRDLKPGNIMLTPTGAKLLDFGLAKPASALADVATMTAAKAETPVTERGTIVGTFQYMSPEQVEGHEVDGRSDIFSLGAVLYEMITGQRAFEGKSRLSVASAILEKEPAPITTVKPLAPAALDHAIRNCLEKDPDNRWQTARDLSHELKWISEAGSQAGVPAISGRTSRATRERIAWATAAVLLCALAALGAYHLRKSTTLAPPAIRAMISPPPDNLFPASETESFFPALSPDGKRLVVPVRDSHGKNNLWLRGLNEFGNGRILPGTENGSFPFWSPDSRSVGFFARGKLKRIDLEGDLIQTIVDVTTQPRGGAWSSDGTILYAPSRFSALYQIPSSGGTPRQITFPAKNEQGHRWPVFLADGRHFLFFVRSQRQPELSGIYASSLDSKEYHLVVNTEGGPAFAFGGRILYVKNEVLITQGFDERRMLATGEPTPLPDHVAVYPINSGALFSASQTGEMVYYAASFYSSTTVSLYARDGKSGSTLDTSPSVVGVRFSPDNTHAVASLYNGNGLSTDLWSYDLSRGAKTRLTSGPESKTYPIWQPDGQFVVFASGFLGGTMNIDRVRSDGSGIVETVLRADGEVPDLPASFCRDGNYLSYSQAPVDSTARSSWILPRTGDKKPFPLIQSRFSNYEPIFSPDCKWVAYASNSTGQPEVYLTHFPDAKCIYQVSTQGGSLPRWRGDGKELFYLSPAADNGLMAVNVSVSGETPTIGSPRTLFHLDRIPTLLGVYDVSSDGQRFLIVTSKDPPASATLTLVTNWKAELNKK